MTDGTVILPYHSHRFQPGLMPSLLQTKQFLINSAMGVKDADRAWLYRQRRETSGKQVSPCKHAGALHAYAKGATAETTVAQYQIKAT